MSCSHCWQSDHTKRKCPNLDKTAEENQRDRGREWNAYLSAANVIAELLGKYAPEKRVDLAMEAFRRADYHFSRPLEAALRERESKAQELLKAEIAKWESVHARMREQQRVKQERRRKKTPTLQGLN